MKNCGKCKEPRELKCFSLRTNGRPQSWCKDCISEHNRATYKASDKRSKQVKTNTAKYRQEKRQFLFDYLTTHPCPCGETNIVKLQFDHLRDKDFTIGCEASHISIDKLKAEIDKCQVLCANCHALKTAIQCNSWKLKWLAR